MAKEKYIRGKVDEAHHDGKRSNVIREQAADYHLYAYLTGEFDDEEKKQSKPKQGGGNG